MAENRVGGIQQGTRLRAGRYELGQTVGRGGAATVWLATDTLLGREVAIKILAEGLRDDPDWLARFRREARIAARLSHPNLVSVYDYEAETDRPYIVMAYMPGGSLRDRLAVGDRPDPEGVAADLLRAVEHIHANGIVHRDVKPGNVLLDPQGTACLSDFGIARPEDATSITRTGQIPGTGAYMAPELWRGEPATERSDLYSTGVLLGEYLGDDDDRPLQDLVARLTAEDPELRPESASAALSMLARESRPEPRTAPAASETTPTRTTQVASDGGLPRPSSSAADRRWAPVAALCALALVAGVLVAQALDDDQPPAPAGQASDAGQDEPAGNGSGDAQADAEPDSSSSPDPTTDAATGAELNDQGFNLIGQGRYDEAIPILEQAVAAFPDKTTFEYGYALYNLGNAYLLAGRPEDAIPLLEERLQIPDQTKTVAKTLKEARKAAAD